MIFHTLIVSERLKMRMVIKKESDIRPELATEFPESVPCLPAWYVGVRLLLNQRLPGNTGPGSEAMGVSKVSHREVFSCLYDKHKLSEVGVVTQKGGEPSLRVGAAA